MNRALEDAAFRERVARAKGRADLAGLVGRTVKLRRAGREFSGLCPFHQEATASFRVVPDKQFAHCFGCGWHGDAIRFLMDADGLTFKDALAAIEGGESLSHRPAAEGAARTNVRPAGSMPPGGVGPDGFGRGSFRRERGGDLIEGRRAAAWAWAAGVPARGSGLAEAWLRSRGIDPDANGFLDVARFVARCPAALWPVDSDPMARAVHAPALVAPILQVEGGRAARRLALRGVHITLLRGDGAGKADLPLRRDGSKRAARLMWGIAAGGAVPIPVLPAPGERALAEFLTALIDGYGDLVVGEGIESTQSLLARQPGARMAWATLSLGNLEGVALRDGPGGALPLWNLRHDPALGRAFTLADPGKVVVGVDADMKPLKDRLVQDRPHGPAVKRDISGAERAMICGALAASQWRAAGASSVAVARPPAGADFNDLDKVSAHG